MPLLIGVGNYYQSDDAIGLHISEQIEDRGLNKEICDVTDVSSDSTRLLFYLREDIDRILIVDAVRMGLSPGDWKIFSIDEVLSKKEIDGFSTHEGDIIKVIGIGRQLGYHLPPIDILGIEPLNMEQGATLTPCLQARFEEYIEAALNHFKIRKC